MIYDMTGNAYRYKGLTENLGRAFDLLDRLESLHLKPGRNVIDGDIHIMSLTYETLDGAKGVYEYHRNFIDIQLVLKGEEAVRYGFQHGYEIESTYDREEDFGTLPLSPGSDILLNPGVFAVFFPGELHAPKLSVTGTPVDVQKIVMKVRIR